MKFHPYLLFLPVLLLTPGDRPYLAQTTPEPRTLRLDYFHSGSAREEHFALDGLTQEGPWPAPLSRSLDDTNFGKYYFEVIDRETNRITYSRGFASIYGEWETTDDARENWGTFHESLRFPMPAAPAQVVLKKRGSRNEFHQVWSVIVDPEAAAIDRTEAPAAGRVWPVMQNGHPRDKIDLLLLGDGYTGAEMDKWQADARHLTEVLFEHSPFKENRSRFNVWAIDTPAAESGVSRPSDGVYRRSPLRANYDAFGSERYILTFDNKRFREIAAAAPYEFVEIIVNNRKYGGGGIFNLYATVSADNAFTPYVFVHEFGHHFAGLADEYYTSDVAYGSPTDRPEPWEPNVTAHAESPKWKALLTPSVPLPTPWPKAEFEGMQSEIQKRRREIRAAGRPEQDMEELFREEMARSSKLLHPAPHAKAIGSFEGAMYESKGYYRPQMDCIMFTRNRVPFCAACRRAIERIMDLYAPR